MKNKNKWVKFVIQDTFSPFMHRFPPVRIAQKQQLKRVDHYPESECNPLKALRKTFRRNSVTKGGGFELMVGFTSWDLNIES